MRPRARRDVRRHLQGRGLRQPARPDRRVPTTTTTSTDEHQLVAGTAWLFARDRAPRGVRPAVHRRGRPVLARRRRRRRALARQQRGPARRPAAAAAGHPGRPPRRLRRIGARAPARRRAARSRRTAASCSPRPGACTPTSARSSPSAATTRACTRATPCAQPQRRRAAGALTGAGCARSRSSTTGRSQASPEEAEAIAAACRDLLAGATVTDDEGADAPLVQPTTSSSSRRTTSPCSCIRDRVPAGRARRHRRPLPGPAGARRLLRDDLLGRRGRAARHRLPLRRPPPQRRDLARAVPRRARPQPAAARRRLPLAGARWRSSTAPAASWSWRRADNLVADGLLPRPRLRARRHGPRGAPGRARGDRGRGQDAGGDRARSRPRCWRPARAACWSPARTPTPARRCAAVAPDAQQDERAPARVGGARRAGGAAAS